MVGERGPSTFCAISLKSFDNGRRSRILMPSVSRAVTNASGGLRFMGESGPL